MALDAVIFDMDGTLLDTNGLHGRAWILALQEFGYNVGEDRVLAEIGKSGDRLVPSVIGQAAAEKDGEALRDRHGAIYLDLVKQEKAPAFPQVRELIGALHQRGLKVAIATAAKKEHLDATLEQADVRLADLADEVVTDTDVEEGKPAPDVVLAAVRKLGLSPAQCAMAGDTPYDAEAALRAGVAFIGVLTGAHDEEAMRRAGARRVYEHTGDLAAHLDEALNAVSPGSVRLTEDRMADLMRTALEEARKGLREGEFPVGAVLAGGDGTILARGHNEVRRRGTPIAHAEVVVLEQLPANLPEEGRGLILVSTLEPCLMCYGAAMEARMDTIVYGLPAPDNGGFERARPLDTPDAVVPRLIGGILADESRDLLRKYLEKHPDDVFTRRLVEQG